MTYLLALDQGTSSSRSIVFDADGRIVAQAQQELPQIYPQPGWVEHDPLEIWRTQLPPHARRWPRPGLHARDMRAVGITNQRETTVVWNRRTGVPVHHAIVWQDRRAEPACARSARTRATATIQAKTGLLVDAYFSGTKLKWMLDHVPGARAGKLGELAFGTVDSWLMWQLTHGGACHGRQQRLAHHAVQCPHQPVGRRPCWRHCDIPRPAARGAMPSSAVWRSRRRPAGPPHNALAAWPGDQQSALFGQACFKAGMVKNTYGTGCFMLMHTGARFQTSHHGLITTSAAQTTPAARVRH
jgi:glycerol kinase